MSDLHNRYSEKGLRILAFPCNQFAGQEPGTNQEIKEFALQRGAYFNLFCKIDVNGANAHPLYKYLKRKQGGTFGDSIKWNFSKFLCDRQGIPVKRYGPNQEPLLAEEDIKALLSQNLD